MLCGAKAAVGRLVCRGDGNGTTRDLRIKFDRLVDAELLARTGRESWSKPDRGGMLEDQRSGPSSLFG